MSVPSIILNRNGSKETKVNDELSIKLLDNWNVLVNKFQKFIEENTGYDPPKRYVPKVVNKISYRKGKNHAKASIFVEAETAVMDSSIKDYTILAKSSPNTLIKEFRWYLDVLPDDIQEVFNGLLEYIYGKYEMHICSIHLRAVDALDCLPSSVVFYSPQKTIQIELHPFNVDAYKRRTVGGIYKDIPFCNTLKNLCMEFVDELKKEFGILKVSHLSYNMKTYGGSLKLLCSPKDGVEYEIKWVLNKIPKAYIDNLNNLLCKCREEFGREVITLNINLLSEDWSISISKRESYINLEVV